tara:strand:+ start:998 stop:1672 length:675 start_codon:yes stop_codon:yes gene_type:complete
MLSTKGMSAGSGNVKPVMGPGNHTVKVNQITYVATPYDAEAYNIVLHLETKPIVGEFNGFLVDVNNPDGPRYDGQVARVRFSPYAFKDATLPNGKKISKVDEVMKAMMVLSETLDKRDQVDSIEAIDVEEFMNQCNTLLSGPEYINVCLGSREWMNKEGYVNNDMYLPKPSKDGVPMESIDVTNSNLLKFDADNSNHLRKVPQSENKETESFEPASKSGSDFEF